MPENNKAKRTEELKRQPGDKIGFFDAEHPFNKLMLTLGTYILANLLFLIGCIPIVTIGVSLSALNKVMMEYERHGDIKVTQIFFKAYKENLVSGLFGFILGMGFLSMGVVGIIMTLPASSLILMFIGFVFFGAMTLGSLCFMTFYFGIISNFNNDLIGHLKNGLIVGVSYIKFGVLIWFLWGIPIIGSYLIPEILVYFGFIWLLFGFSGLSYVTCKLYKRVFVLVKYRDIDDEN